MRAAAHGLALRAAFTNAVTVQPVLVGCGSGYWLVPAWASGRDRRSFSGAGRAPGKHNKHDRYDDAVPAARH